MNTTELEIGLSESEIHVQSRGFMIFVCHPSDMLTDILPNGDGLLADQFIRQLASRGHRIHVAVANHHIKVGYPENVTLYMMNAKSGTLWSRLKFGLEMRTLLRTLSKTIKFDVIQQLNPVVTGLSLALVGSKIPLVMGPYVPDWPSFVNNGRLQSPPFTRKVSKPIKRMIWNLQHKLAAGIIMSTPAALAKVKCVHAVKEKLNFIPFGIDTKKFVPAPFPKIPTVVFMGHVEPYKGISVLIEAFERLHERLPEARLIVAGTGSELEPARIRAESTVAGRQIKFLGNVERCDIPRLLNDSTVFCLPSYGEAFGLSVLEAMACGRPVVGTNEGGLAHLISPKGGRKVPMGDASELADALFDLLSDTLLVEAMGTYNRKLSEELYSWPRVIDRLETVYWQLIDANSRMTC